MNLVSCWRLYTVVSHNRLLFFLFIDGINPIAWPYIIMGILIVLMSLILWIMALLDIEGKVQTDHEETYEKRAEEPIKNVAFLLLLVIGFYTFLVASENVFQLYIYSVAVCSDLQFSVCLGITWKYYVLSYQVKYDLGHRCISIKRHVLGRSYDWEGPWYTNSQILPTCCYVNCNINRGYPFTCKKFLNGFYF